MVHCFLTKGTTRRGDKPQVVEGARCRGNQKAPQFVESSSARRGAAARRWANLRLVESARQEGEVTGQGESCRVGGEVTPTSCRRILSRSLFLVSRLVSSRLVSPVTSPRFVPVLVLVLVLVLALVVVLVLVTVLVLVLVLILVLVLSTSPNARAARAPGC
jgi:hypothetical protein